MTTLTLRARSSSGCLSHSSPLALPIASAARGPAAQAVAFLLEQPQIQRLFVDESGLAHQELVNVLENKTGYGIRTGNGIVAVDLGEPVRQIGAEVGIPASALEKLPADAGVVTVMRSSQLSLAQQAVRAVRLLSVWLVVLAFGLYALAVYLARGARRETVRTIGSAFALAGLVGLVLRQLAGSYAVDVLLASQMRSPTAR